MATNRFVCEICNKGFQRDQNLQLHRRGHNLPWKLKQRTGKEVVRKRVYVCPEKTCVHHDPVRALGDLTGIKKHFSRKHGEKKWKCDKCSKKYAVQSDWKAHSKICGTREYKCDCGTIFSRKDSFITHRAFCDALTEESARLSSTVAAATNAGPAAGLVFKSNVLCVDGGNNPHLGLGHDLLPSSSIPQLHHLLRHPYASGDMSQDGVLVDRHRTSLSLWLDSKAATASSPHHLNPAMDMTPAAAEYLAATSLGLPELLQMASAGSTFGSSQQAVVDYAGCPVPQQSVASLSLSNPAAYGLGEEDDRKGQLGECAAPPFYSCNLAAQQESSAHMSATALLQKAAQMGATTSHHTSSSSSSFLSGFGGLMSSAKSTMHPPMENKNEFQLLLNQKQPTENLYRQGLLPNTLPTIGNGENLVTTTNAASDMLAMMAAAGREQQLLMPAGKMTAWSQEAGRGLTRDFLGVGGDDSSRPFLQQELAKFASMDSGMHLMSASYDGSH
ncbi:hypothetical protein Taro_021312 [Colocasia esculenta]|uniref:C2H2-type domain-containing protein n=1 Tax=Colocasia esculenta TaxID=4460 RepID=A0A843V0Z8_COLES|nr:hypothetical protein [Colocasia esculenta]